MYNIWIMNHHATTKCRHSYFAQQLGNRGHNVKLFATSFKHNDFKEIKKYPDDKYSFKESEESYQRVWIKTSPYKGNGLKRLFNQISFAYRSYKVGSKMKKPNIIIGSSVHLFTCLAAFFLAKKHNVPFIFEVRDLWPQTLIDLGVLSNKNPVTIFFRFLEKFLYKKADKIISVLPEGDKYISSLGINKEKIVHIPNGVDLIWFDNNAEGEIENEKLNDFFINTEGLIYSYTGAHGLANGLETLVKAAKKIQNKGIKGINFLLVGSGPEKDRLIKLAKQYNLKNLTFIPRVNKNIVPKILIKSDVCLFHLRETPVFKYGISSNKIFDYLASGKPMISALKATFDFADVANCGIAILPENPEKLADAVIKMSKMTESERKKFGENGRKFVEQNHDYAILADRLLKVIEEVM